MKKALVIQLCLVSYAAGGFAQKMTVKDSENNILMEVNDEGQVGSITLPDTANAPASTTNKLYNLGGSLYWNGAALATGSGGSGGWTDDGSVIRLSANGDSVGIGTATPESKLEVAGTIHSTSGGIKFPDNTIQTTAAGPGMETDPQVGTLINGRWCISDGVQIHATQTAPVLNEVDPQVGSNSTNFVPKWDGTELLSGTIYDNGKIGIGTSSPDSKLDVRGDTPEGAAVISVGNSDASHRLRFFGGHSNDPNPFIWWKDGDPLRFSTDAGGWSEKMRITSGGNVGIGTSTPTEMLEVADTVFSSIGGFKFPDGTVQETAATGVSGGNTLDQAYDQGGAGAGRTINADAGAVTINGTDGFLSTGTFGSGTIPFEGAGTRMMWYPEKASFRVGYISGTEWDHTSIGDYSIAMGYGTKASADYSTATGKMTLASNLGSTALGDHALASGIVSTAMGSYSIASGNYSTAMGSATAATGSASTAIGYSTIASGEFSTAIGQEIEANGEYSVAIALSDQNGLSVTQNNTMAIMGGTVGIGTASPNKLLHVYTDTESEIAVFENESTSDPDGIMIKAGPDVNPGNGIDYVIFQDGDGDLIGSIDGDGTGGIRYNTTSDARLKMKIRDFSGGLNTVSKIQVRNYEMKSAPGIENVGFIAQELQEVYPQAVSGSPDSDPGEDPMMIDYGKITPVLVSALQELNIIKDKEIEELKSMINSLKNRIDKLERMK